MRADETPAAGGAVRFAFLERYWNDHRRGCLRAADDYAREFPGFEAIVRREFERLLNRRGDPHAVGVDRIGPYLLIREIGRGGQAVVYQARDPELDRTVALKVLRVGPAFHRRSLERFVREARVASRLEARGICPVYAAGEENGLAWIAMRYVPGETLVAYLQRDLRSRRECLACLVSVLRTLHVAHGAGVIHRDLKPSNIVLGPDGPVVLDFGLAQSQADPSQATLTGEQIGTPAYMAPEQIRGDAVDRRVDVYACGIVAYEMLAGTHPFDAPTRELMVRRKLDEPAPRLSGVPSALRTVIATALAPNPEQRYSTAAAFADDLERFARGQPILARRPSAVRRAILWARAHKALTALLVSLVWALAVSLLLLFLVQDEQRRTRDSLRRSRALALAGAAMEEGRDDPQLGLLLALRAYDTSALPESLSAVYRCWDSMRVVCELQGDGTPVSATALLDSERVLCGYEDGHVRMFSGAGDARDLSPHAGRVTAIVADSLGRSATAGSDGVVVVRDHNGARRARFDLGASVQALALARDDALLCGTEDGAVFEASMVRPEARPRELWHGTAGIVRLLKAPSGAGLLALTRGREAVVLDRSGHVRRRWQTDMSTAAAYLGDGESVVTTRIFPDASRGLYVVDLTGSRVREVPRLFPIAGIATGPDGRVAVGGGAGLAMVLDLERGTSVPLRGHSHSVPFLEFDADGYILTGSFDHTLRVFGPSGNPRQVFRGHRAPVTHASFVNDASRVLSASRDGTVMLWDRRGPGELDLGRHRWAGRAFASEDGSTIAVVVEHGVLLLPRSGDKQPVRLRAREARPLHVSFAGDRVLVVLETGRAGLFDRKGNHLGTCPRHVLFPSSLLVDGGRAVVTNLGRELLKWDESGELTRFTGHDAPICVVATAGDIVVTGDTEGGAKLWHTSGVLRADLNRHDGPVAAVAASSRGLVASAGADGRVRVYGSDGSLLANCEGHSGAVSHLEFSRDGRLLLTVSEDATARVFRVDGTPVATLRGHTGALEVASLAPGGDRIATVGRDGRVLLWSIDGTRLVELPRLSRPAHHIEFTPDGRELLVSGLGDRVCLWPLDPAELLARARARCCRTMTKAEAVRFATLLADNGGPQSR